MLFGRPTTTVRSPTTPTTIMLGQSRESEGTSTTRDGTPVTREPEAGLAAMKPIVLGEGATTGTTVAFSSAVSRDCSRSSQRSS